MIGATPDELPLAVVLDRWDELARRLGLDSGERSSLLGAFAKGGVRDVCEVAAYAPSVSEQRMRLLVGMIPLLARVFHDERRERFWLRNPNEALGGQSPLDAMASSSEWIRWIAGALVLVA